MSVFMRHVSSGTSISKLQNTRAPGPTRINIRSNRSTRARSYLFDKIEKSYITSFFFLSCRFFCMRTTIQTEKKWCVYLIHVLSTGKY